MLVLLAVAAAVCSLLLMPKAPSLMIKAPPFDAFVRFVACRGKPTKLVMELNLPKKAKGFGI